MVSELSNSEIKDIEDVISIYGNQFTQTISTNMLGPALRAMKLNPLEREIINYISEFDKGGSGTLKKSQFITIYNRKKQDPDTLENLTKSLKFLDKSGTGLLSIQEFKYFMCKMGEPIAEVDLDDILKLAEIDYSSKIDIESFAKTIIDKKL